MKMDEKDKSKKNLKKFINKTVIDATALFRRSKKEVNNIDKQSTQEAKINAMLTAVENEANDFIGRKRFLLACPACYDKTQDGWSKKMGPYVIISYVQKTKSDDYKQITNFVQDNKDKFLNLIDNIEMKLKEIEKTADDMTWMIPWRQHTQLNYTQHDFIKFKDNIRKMLA